MPACASVATMAIAMPVMPMHVAAARRLRVRQPTQRQDEQDGGDQVGERGQGRRASRPPHCFFLNICSMRWVTRKPPKMLTLASMTAMKPNPARPAGHGQPRRQHRAHHDHRGDRVGHRHQRRVQRRGDVPHHVVADEAGHHEDREQEDERLHRLGHRSGGDGHRRGLFGEHVWPGAASRPCLIGQLGGVHALGSPDQAAWLGCELRMHDGATARQQRAFDDLVTVREASARFASLSQNVVRNVSRLRA